MKSNLEEKLNFFRFRILKYFIIDTYPVTIKYGT